MKNLLLVMPLLLASCSRHEAISFTVTSPGTNEMFYVCTNGGVVLTEEGSNFIASLVAYTNDIFIYAGTTSSTNVCYWTNFHGQHMFTNGVEYIEGSPVTNEDTSGWAESDFTNVMYSFWFSKDQDAVELKMDAQGIKLLRINFDGHYEEVPGCQYRRTYVNGMQYTEATRMGTRPDSQFSDFQFVTNAPIKELK